MQTWTSVNDRGGCIFGFDSNEMFLGTVWGKRAKGPINAADQAIRAGTAPGAIEEIDPVTVSLSSVEWVQVTQGNPNVEVFYRDETGETERMWFSPQRGRDREIIARQLVAAVNRPSAESKADVGMGTALAGPVVGLIATAVLGGILYVVANGLEAGEEIEASGRRSGLKQLFIWAAEALGTQGTIIVVLLLVGTCIAFGVKNVLYPPQIQKWTFQPQ